MSEVVEKKQEQVQASEDVGKKKKVRLSPEERLEKQNKNHKAIVKKIKQDKKKKEQKKLLDDMKSIHEAMEENKVPYEAVLNFVKSYKAGENK